MSVRLIRSGEYQRMRWKNGGGWTSELARAGDDAAFDWRISIAEIESDGAFSTFSGCDRQIALLDGTGMEIAFDEAESIRLDQRLRFFSFAGEWHARGRLIGGPVRDFNVIVRRDAFKAEVLYRPLVGPMVFLPEAATTWFIHLAGGGADLQDVRGMELDAGDSLLLEPGDGVRNRVLSGGGEVVLVKLTAQ
ncbi:MAG TPA: HutD family protein [Rudaea sp.]|jgi:hypothetical protein